MSKHDEEIIIPQVELPPLAKVPQFVLAIAIVVVTALLFYATIYFGERGNNTETPVITTSATSSEETPGAHKT